MKVLASILSAIVTLCAFAGQATAGLIYTLKAYPGQPPEIAEMTSTTTGISWDGSATRTAPGQFVTGDWSLSADTGVLTSAISATANGVYGAPNQFVGSSQFRYDDLIISGYTGPGGVSPGINVALNLRLVGQFGYESGAGFGSVTVNVNFGAHPLSGGGQFKSGNATGAGSQGGFLSSIPVGPDGTIDSNIRIPFRATASETFPNSLTITLETRVWGGDIAFGDGLASSYSDFTLHFATDRPVFELPEGLTVNSEQAGIVDNQYTQPSSAVPEPSSYLQFLCGMLVLLSAGWRRRRKLHATQSA